MRRVIAGLRAARTRPDKGVQIAIAAAGVLFLAACGPGTAESSFPAPVAGSSITDAATTAAPTTAAPTTTAPVTTTATPAPTTAAPTTPAPKPVPKPKPVPRPAPKPAPKPVPKPAPKPPPAAPSNCDPSYPDVCLKDGIGDYDCKPGTGNGPNYVTGPIRVRGADPFGLDGNDHDGIGCEG